MASKSAESGEPILFVLVEGEDDKLIIKHLLASVNVPHEVRAVGSKGEFEQELRVLIKSEQFRRPAKRLVLIRDADQNASDARKSLKGVVDRFRKLDGWFAARCKHPDFTVEYVVLPLGKTQGCLEVTLLDAWAKDSGALECARSAMSTCKEHAPRTRWSEHKATLQCALALTKDNPRSLGVAWNAGCFNPNAKPLVELRNRILG